MSFEHGESDLGILGEPVALIIDDEFTSRVILNKIISGIHPNITVEPFSNPIAAMDWAKLNLPDIILVDHMMNAMSGVELIKHMRRIPHLVDVPIVFVTANEDRDVRYQALSGGATDFILKPIDPYECQTRCRNLLSMRIYQRLILERTQSLEQAIAVATQPIIEREHETLFRLAKAGEFRDADTGNSVPRMAKYSSLIAQGLGLKAEHCNLIEFAAPMHDIGKIGVQDQILTKPGKLNFSEFEMMKKHPLIGYEILQNSSSKFIRLGAEIALSHHEKFDGSGYPYGTKGDEIPLEARIVAVADVYDALTSARPYKTPWSVEQTLDYLTNNKGSHFDPDCVNAFMLQYEKVKVIQQQLPDLPDPSGLKVAK
jgi:two-component system response regulator RpfG